KDHRGVLLKKQLGRCQNGVALGKLKCRLLDPAIDERDTAMSDGHAQRGNPARGLQPRRMLLDAELHALSLDPCSSNIAIATCGVRSLPQPAYFPIATTGMMASAISLCPKAFGWGSPGIAQTSSGLSVPNAPSRST